MDCKYTSGRILHAVPFNHIFDCLSTSKSFYCDEGSNCYFQCTLESNFTKIVVTDLIGKSNISFNIIGISKIYSIRINKNLSYCVVQRSGNYIELITINLDNFSNILCYESDKDSHIRSFSFIKNDFLIIISNNSIKTFKITSDPTKISFNSIININSTWTSWFLSPKFYLIAHGNSANNSKLPASSQQIGIVLFNNNNYKTKTFNFNDTGQNSISNKIRFFNFNLNNIQFISLYNSIYLTIIDQNPIEIYLYKVENRLDLNIKYIFNINCESIDASLVDLNIGVVDNIITLHNRNEKFTYLFDISVSALNSESNIYVCPQLVDKPKTSSSASSTSLNLKNNFEYIDIYNKNYIFHKPDLVFDTVNGIVYQIHIDLDYISFIFNSSSMDLVIFYMHRIDAKNILLRVISDYIFSKNQNVDIINIFDYIIKCNSLSISNDSNLNKFSKIAYDVDQQDIHVNIFFPLINSTVSMSTDNHRSHLYYCYNIILSFIMLLKRYKHNVQHHIIETLTDVMVKLGMIDQLNDLLYCNFFSPSRELCKYFISLCNIYPSLCSNVLNMCCLVDSLDGIFQLIAQQGSDSVINRFLKTINSLEICDENNKRVNIFTDLKINDTFPMEITKKSAQNVEIETISNLLKTLSIRKTIEKLNIQ